MSDLSLFTFHALSWYAPPDKNISGKSNSLLITRNEAFLPSRSLKKINTGKTKRLENLNTLRLLQPFRKVKEDWCFFNPTSVILQHCCCPYDLIYSVVWLTWTSHCMKETRLAFLCCHNTTVLNTAQVIFWETFSHSQCMCEYGSAKRNCSSARRNVTVQMTVMSIHKQRRCCPPALFCSVCFLTQLLDCIFLWNSKGSYRPVDRFQFPWATAQRQRDDHLGSHVKGIQFFNILAVKNGFSTFPFHVLD